MNAFFWRKPSAVVAPDLTRHIVELRHPSIAQELRDEGARLERDRIFGVYRAGSQVDLHPLIERLMFDGRTPPEAAALAVVALRQADVAIMAEAMRVSPQAVVTPNRH